MNCFNRTSPLETVVEELARFDVELGLGPDPRRCTDSDYKAAYRKAVAARTARVNAERTAALGRTREYLGLQP